MEQPLTASMMLRVPPPEPQSFTATGAGMVGTGRTPQEARQDLMEKIRQAREA
jgi:hypothetical protein